MLPALNTSAQDTALSSSAQRPNLLLILADDMTYTDLGCHGHPDVRTPNLDALAGQGMMFERCYNSAPMCAPTRMSLYTGIHPVRNGAYPNHSRVHDHVRSIPHYLKPLGYSVGLIGKRHYEPKENFPFEFLGGRDEDDGTGVDLEISDAGDFITRNSSNPWCLVVSSNQPHGPWNRGDSSAYNADALTLPPYLVDTPETRRLLTKYYAEITYLDDQVGQVLAKLKESRQAENTVVLFLSEQGSAFPHCKWTCYDTGLHSAAIVKWPGVVRAGTTSKALIQYVDVLPTFLAIAGGDPTREDFDGRSFLPVLKGQTDRHHQSAFGIQTSKGIANGPDAYGIRTICDGDFRLIWNLHHEIAFKNNVVANFSAYRSWKKKGEAGDAFALAQYLRYQNRPEFELYDMVADPFEMENLAADPAHGDRVRRMRNGLQEWMRQQGDQGRATEEAALTRQPRSSEDSGNETNSPSN